jgi:acyl dehydratase
LAVDTQAVGKTYPPFEYAVGEESPVHHDAEAARAEGFRNVVAPPMFAVVYSAGAMGPAILDPDVGINLMMMLHGSQEFVWSEPVCAGDTITTTAEVREIYEKDGKGFYVFESVSRNQDGQEVVRGTWTNIVRGV